MIAVWRAALVLAFALQLTACAPADSTSMCTLHAPTSGVARAALRGGSPDELFLMLESEQQAAVVAVLVDPGPEGPAEICSGTLVSLEQVLTAAHCFDDLEGLPVEVRIGAKLFEPARRIDAIAELHPELDLALLTLAEAISGSEAAVVPFAVGSGADYDAWIDRPMVVGGYGLDDNLDAGTRAFALASIHAIDERFANVRGAGDSGVCFGDSGGPLLARMDDGAPAVLGVLAKGSRACNGEDSYTRLDLAAAWLEERVGEQEQVEVECTRLPVEGRCFGAAALRCEDAQLEVEACNGDRVCGWDAARMRYGCVEPNADACIGTAEVGRCEGDRALSCESGVLDAVDCGACGMRCEISATDGRAQCVDP